MSETLDKVRRLVAYHQVSLSDHAEQKLRSTGIKYREVLAGIDMAVLVEDYPHYNHGPAVLVRQPDAASNLIHVLWGIPADGTQLAFVVTVYRPDDRWDAEKLKRIR